jgi:hypothetical protein
MRGTGRTTGGDPLRPITRGPLATFIVLVVAAAIVVVGGFGLLSMRAPEPSGSPAQASPTASGGVAEGWGAIGDLPPLEPVASLAATFADSAGVAPESAFTLTSLGGSSAMALAGGLAVEPSQSICAPSRAYRRQRDRDPAKPLCPGSATGSSCARRTTHSSERGRLRSRHPSTW